MVGYSHLEFSSHFVIIHPVKGFCVVNEAEVDVFSGTAMLSSRSNECWKFDLWFPCIFEIPLYVWKFSVHILLKPSLKDFEHNFASM